MNKRWVPRDYRLDKPATYKLRNPELTDAAFNIWPKHIDMVNGIDSEFDDIENAEQDAVDYVKKNFIRETDSWD